MDRPIVLVHGAWHGAWCWASLQAELDRRGLGSFALDLPGHGTSLLPLGGLHHDAAHLGVTLDHLGLDGAVLVGHSYGGAVITHAAAARSDISHLVYVAAFALDDGESVSSALRSFERLDVPLSTAVRMVDDDTTVLDAGLAPAALYGSCPPEMAAAAISRLSPQPLATMTEPVGGSPRSHIDSTYVRCLRDEAVHPTHQAQMGARCSALVDIDTDHSPFLSAVDELADVLESIARA